MKARNKARAMPVNQEISELITFKNSQNTNIRGSLLKLSQSYIVFEVYNPYSIVQLSEILQDVKIQRAGSKIYEGKATITNIINTGIILIVSATIYDEGWEDESSDKQNSIKIKNEMKYLISDFDLQQKINQDFKSSILNMRSFLMDSQNWLNRLEPSLLKSNTDLNAKYILENFQPLFKKLNKLSNICGETSLNINNKDLNLHKRFAQSQLHPLILSAPFTHRIYTKPLGFAGDYMMMHMIQRENAEGQNLYAKFINTYYTNIPITSSVKNRTDTLIKLISEGVKKAEKENREFHSLSIGCGPALEIKKFIKNNNPKIKCNFKLLDFNEETLNFAKKEAEKEIESKLFSIETQLDSVHALLKQSISSNNMEEKYDLIYCSGLFDYLSDRICSKLTQMFYRMVKKDGIVLVTNMHSDDIDRNMTELLFEWYLIYRDEKNMQEFVHNLGKQQLFKDVTGINLSLQIKK